MRKHNSASCLIKLSIFTIIMHLLIQESSRIQCFMGSWIYVFVTYRHQILICSSLLWFQARHNYSDSNGITKPLENHSEGYFSSDPEDEAQHVQLTKPTGKELREKNLSLSLKPKPELISQEWNICPLAMLFIPTGTWTPKSQLLYWKVWGRFSFMVIPLSHM